MKRWTHDTWANKKSIVLNRPAKLTAALLRVHHPVIKRIIAEAEWVTRIDMLADAEGMRAAMMNTETNVSDKRWCNIDEV